MTSKLEQILGFKVAQNGLLSSSVAVNRAEDKEK
jgi:hypothetical protein